MWHSGVASAMMNYAIEWAKSIPILVNLHLEVRSDNSRAIALYERFGFQRVGIFPQKVCVQMVIKYMLLAEGSTKRLPNIAQTCIMMRLPSQKTESIL